MNAVLKPQPDQSNRWVTFRLAEEKYGINVRQVQEALRPSEIAPVPGAPSSVLGIINLRGNVHTVVDARLLLGLPRAGQSEQAWVTIVECNRNSVGLLVDSGAEVVNIENADIDSAPHIRNGERARHARGVHGKHGEIRSELNRLPGPDLQLFSGAD
jgi:purine-binding chemotaxis protein CheW